jgi:geranylgeranyl pyrophosphate synthase
MEATTATFFDLVRAEMPAVEACMRASPAQHHPNLDAAIEHLLSSGGKRIRPAVVLLTGAMLGADRERTTTMAAAIEMLHTATLVHWALSVGTPRRSREPSMRSSWAMPGRRA